MISFFKKGATIYVVESDHALSSSEAEKFNSTHFNSNVVIYDIPVEKLTVKKATAKINEKANDILERNF